MNLYKVIYTGKKGKAGTGKLISSSLEAAKAKFERLPHRTLVDITLVAWE